MVKLWAWFVKRKGVVMPIYEYVCGGCGHQLEKLQKMSADPITNCPECKKDTLSRKISASSFTLTGDGWYVTDFKDKKPKNDTKPAASEGKTAPPTPPTSKADS